MFQKKGKIGTFASKIRKCSNFFRKIFLDHLRLKNFFVVITFPFCQETEFKISFEVLTQLRKANQQESAGRPQAFYQLILERFFFFYEKFSGQVPKSSDFRTFLVLVRLIFLGKYFVSTPFSNILYFRLLFGITYSYCQKIIFPIPVL